MISQLIDALIQTDAHSRRHTHMHTNKQAHAYTLKFKYTHKHNFISSNRIHSEESIAVSKKNRFNIKLNKLLIKFSSINWEFKNKNKNKHNDRQYRKTKKLFSFNDYCQIDDSKQ